MPLKVVHVLEFQKKKKKDIMQFVARDRKRVMLGIRRSGWAGVSTGWSPTRIRDLAPLEGALALPVDTSYQPNKGFNTGRG